MFVCLFDIDGTLVSSGGAGKAALEAGLAEEFGIRDVMGPLKLSGRTDTAILTDLLHLAGLDNTSDNRRRLLAAYLRHLPACMRSHRGRVLPGVADLLTLLRSRNDVALGLLTSNVRDGARIKLGHFGLFDHFSFGGYGDEHHDRDDVARVALDEVTRHLGDTVDPRRVWVIGDTPFDVRCARAIGANVLAVLTGWHSREELHSCSPDLLLDDLSDPGPWLTRW